MFGRGKLKVLDGLYSGFWSAWVFLRNTMGVLGYKLEVLEDPTLNSGLIECSGGVAFRALE